MAWGMPISASTKPSINSESCICGGLTLDNFGVCMVYPNIKVSTQKECQSYCNKFKPANNSEPDCAPNACTGYIGTNGMQSCLTWCQSVSCISNARDERK
jgi:hypothetical protein